MFCPIENDTIYWVDMGLSTISRAKRDQTWREDIVTNGIGRVEGITVDWIAGEHTRTVTVDCTTLLKSYHIYYNAVVFCVNRKHLLD